MLALPCRPAPACAGDSNGGGSRTGGIDIAIRLAMLVRTETKRLFESTLRELFQAERSGAQQPHVEAERLGQSPPAAIMDEIASHAASALAQLEDIARERGVSPSDDMKTLGRTLSGFRD